MPIQVLAEPLLYDIMKNKAETDSLVKEYTGEHQDLIDGSGQEKIYHFFASTGDEADEIIGSRNVVFANSCWEMIRTTDGGGVRMIYNGETLNEKCGEIRKFSTKVSSSSEKVINSDESYYFADDYLNYSIGGGFLLDDSKASINLSEIEPSSLIGKYTFFYSYENYSSSAIYKITGFNDETNTLTYDVLSVKNYMGSYYL